MGTQNLWLPASGGSGDINLAGNWSDGIPTANDSAVVGGATAAMTTNLAALTAIDLDIFWVRRGFPNSIGASGNALTITADKVLYQGGFDFAPGGTFKEFWFSDGSGGTTDQFIMDAASPDAVVHLTGGVITEVMAIKGNLSLDSGVTVGRMSIGHRTSPQGDCRVTINTGVTISADPAGQITQSAGKCTCSLAIPKIMVHGGEWTQNTATPVYVDVGSGGRFNLIHSAATTIVVHSGGTIDLSQYNGLITITTLYLHPGSRVIGNIYDTNHITVTNQIYADFEVV